MAAINPNILVTGDVVLDHNLYAGRRFTPDAPALTGLRHIARPGGAMLAYELLDALRKLVPISKDGDGKRVIAPHVFFGLTNAKAKAMETWPTNFKVGALWNQFDGQKKNEPVWRMEKHLGYGPLESKPYPGKPASNLGQIDPRLIVIDDGGLGFRFRTASDCWPAVLTTKDVGKQLQWIILKMSSPLARGDLWRLLVDQWREKLIVVVGADNLRREDVRITRGLSWESTVDDLVDEVQSNPSVAGLNTCRHLVITLRGDAALWFSNSNQSESQCHLIFDRERGEGEWEDGISLGNAFGYLSAVTAALVWHLWNIDETSKPNLVPALKAGLSTSRFLRQHGHGLVNGGKSIPSFPFALAAEHIRNPQYKYACTEVQCCVEAPNERIGPDAASTATQCKVAHKAYWTIFRKLSHSETISGPLFGPARRLALFGPAALADVPIARFGKLLSLNRHEIESLRSIRQLMLSYHRNNPQKQPLSVAVFGAPGSGKSFGLKQIAEEVFGSKNPILEFNLSQFKGPEDLIGAYHQIRDHALAGKTPVAFWDEFDSGNYSWLRYLLAPMQDGLFQEGQLTHFIGKSVFVFAGGTSRDFAHFGPSEEPLTKELQVQRNARNDFIMAKGPDFKSRLAGYFDVLGPNPRQEYDAIRAHRGLNPWKDDPSDIEFPARRALLLRALLDFVKERESDVLEIDRGLLTALLEIGHYKHGARSMEKLIFGMRDRGDLPLRRAYLPDDDLLSLHVDNVEEFRALIRRSYAFLAQAETLAPIIHKDWMDTLPKKERHNNEYYLQYELLSQEGKAANIAAASRIPEILALVGYILVKGQASKSEQKSVGAFLKQNLDFLAEAEHDGWADQKRMEGWTYGPEKVFPSRKQPLLVPYKDLPQEQKDKDRKTILNYPKYAKLAGFKIVRGKMA